MNSKLTMEELINKIKTYITDEQEINNIIKAYMFAYEKHLGQKRKTGEDYIKHPLNVAYILSKIMADSSTISAALLHNVLEDTDLTKEQLEQEFGLEVANIVEGVTTINKLNFNGSTESLNANQQKIIVGLSKDVRVIILKLADRLHNLQTLWALPEKKQKEKAKETLEILTPIADRLGMSQIKSELEELSFRYLHPEDYYSIVEKLNSTKAQRDNSVNKMIENVSELLNTNNIKHEIKGRSKSIYSIYKKLSKGKRFSDIYDILALRVFVDTKSDCYQALGIIHSKFRPIPKRFKDYIAMPKTNMYQSLHTTVFGIDGELFEIQIRTYEMNNIAEHGIAAHWSYKEKGSNTKAAMQNDMEQKLQFFRSIMELKSSDEDPDEFVNSVKQDVLKNTIYVFTPLGDVIELPKGATPIDFAYKVHTKVGDNMIGAIVNSSIVPLDYELNDNDIVKINTGNDKTPSKEWLNIAKTTQAKNKIKAYFNRIDKEEYYNKGNDLITKELKKQKIPLNIFFKEENIKKLTTLNKLGDQKELLTNVGNGKIKAIDLITALNPEKKPSPETLIPKTTSKEKINKNDIIVSGMDEIKVNLAACCKPVKGDRIVGYITKGEGITVHRMVCPNMKDREERVIAVEWNNNIESQYQTSLKVNTDNNDNTLVNIITKISNNNCSLKSVNNIKYNNENVYEISVIISNKQQLIKLMNDIKSIKDVLEIERLIK